MLVLHLGKLEQGDKGWDVLYDWCELWIPTRTRTHKGRGLWLTRDNWSYISFASITLHSQQFVDSTHFILVQSCSI